MVRTFEEAVNIMVEWWVNKAFHTPLNQSNGAESTPDSLKSDFMALALGNIIASDIQNETTPEQIKTFRSTLKYVLMNDDYSDFAYHYTWGPFLDVDYNPNERLLTACKAAEINPRVLPIKHRSYIDLKDHKVYVKPGYGAEIIEIN